MPNGDRVRFPDDMPGDQIKQMILKKFPDADKTSRNVDSAEPTIGRAESFGRGAIYGAIQQPRDVIAALTAKVSEGVPFQEGLEMARQMSLEGRQGLAQKERPGYFGTGQVAGNILTTAIPAGSVTKALGLGQGLLGVPAAGAVQGAMSTLASEGDLSGALPGALGAGIVNIAGKVAKPIAIGAASAARKGFTETLKAAGIDDLTAAQITGNKTLELIEATLAKMPFTSGKSRAATEKQLRKFTTAALKKAGLTGDDIGPEVRAAAEAQFSKRFGDLVENETVNIDDKVIQVLSNVETNQLNKLPTNIKPIVMSYIDDILNTGGKMSGEAYQAARSQLSQQARSLSVSDPFTANTLRTLRNALDDAAERSLPTGKKGIWKELNRQYSNYKIIQKTASSLSKDSLEGVLSPKTLLRNIESANKTKGQKGYGDLYDLARSGAAILDDAVPDSGTAQRQLVQSILTGGGLGLGAGGATYYATHDPETALAAAALSIGGPSAVQAVMNSAAGKRYLTKGLPVAGSLLNSEITKIIAAISAAQSSKAVKNDQ
jgi:hypothetical protein